MKQRPPLSEIAFGPPTRPELRVWVEIKHGADPHDDQLATYVGDIAHELQDEWLIVLLAPRQSLQEHSDGATPVEWQQLGRFLQRHAKRAELSDVGHWLLAQFTSYLKEHGLMDDEALTPAHAFELSARPATERIIGRIVEVARPTMTQRGAARKTTRRRARSLHSESAGGPPIPCGGETTWGPAWFEWLREDAFRPEPKDAIAFFAGITFQSAKTAPFDGRATKRGWRRSTLADSSGFSLGIGPFGARSTLNSS